MLGATRETERLAERMGTHLKQDLSEDDTIRSNRLLCKLCPKYFFAITTIILCKSVF